MIKNVSRIKKVSFLFDAQYYRIFVLIEFLYTIETPSFIKNPLGSFHKLIEKDPNPLNQQHHSSPQLQRLLKPSPVGLIVVIHFVALRN